jgi:NarL family two-component system response regulator LiaR
MRDQADSDTIFVLVADDHAIIRTGIRAMLEVVPDIDVAGEATNGRETIAKAQRLLPDVILMDLVMPEVNGIEAIRRIKEVQPGARILVLTTFAGEDMVFPAIKAGAQGYHLKDSSPEELVRAIRQVYRGESSLHPVIARKVLEELSHSPERPPTSDPLTPREMQVLRLIAQGLDNAEIAEKLVISEGTARTHVSKILGKLHLANRIKAALYALREGLASLEDAS